MSKRRAEYQLTDRDDPEALVGDESGNWKQASAEVMAGRKIVKAKRKGSNPAVNVSEEVATPASKPEETPASKPEETTSSTTSASQPWPTFNFSSTSSVPSWPTFPAVTSTPEKKADDATSSPAKPAWPVFSFSSPSSSSSSSTTTTTQDPEKKWPTFQLSSTWPTFGSTTPTKDSEKTAETKESETKTETETTEDKSSEKPLFQDATFQFTEQEKPKADGGYVWPKFNLPTTPSWPSLDNPLLPAQGDSKDTVARTQSPTILGVNVAPPKAPVESANADANPTSPTKLAKLDEVKTGEEGEETEFKGRAKLYQFTGQWSERGVGLLKVNYNATKKSTRLIMRGDTTGKLLLNLGVFAQMVAAKQSAKVARVCGFNHAEAGSDLKMENFLLRFLSDDDTTKCLDIIQAAITRTESTSQDKPKEEVEEKKEETEPEKEKPEEKKEAETATA